MVWTCIAQHRLDCRSTQAECGCTEKIWQAKEIMGWSAWEWQKEARYGFCWPSESFWVERTPSRKTCQKAQPSVEENRALKWIWWWWWLWKQFCDADGIVPYHVSLINFILWKSYFVFVINIAVQSIVDQVPVSHAINSHVLTDTNVRFNKAVHLLLIHGFVVLRTSIPGLSQNLTS